MVEITLRHALGILLDATGHLLVGDEFLGRVGRIHAEHRDHGAAFAVRQVVAGRLTSALIAPSAISSLLQITTSTMLLFASLY